MELYYAYLRLLVAFPLVIALLYFSLRFILPFFAPALSMGRRLRVVERIALNNKAFLYVVNVDKQYFLLAATPNSVTLLKDLGEGWDESLQGVPETAKIQREPLPFAGGLGKLSRKLKACKDKIIGLEGRGSKKDEK